jgi:chloramphenicol-sensitive protein RarD
MIQSIKQQGLFFGFLAFLAWGFFPLYWKFLAQFESWELVLYRILWSAFFYGLGLVFFAPGPKMQKRDWSWTALAAVLIAINWVAYIYAVLSGHILQGSLAYFINPLLSVVLGGLVFKEKLSWLAKTAVAVAALGILSFSVAVGDVPWLSLLMAGTFGVYGLCKKMIKARPMLSSFWESSLLWIPALILLIIYYPPWIRIQTPTEFFLLMGTGLVTGLPLLWFSIAIQRVPMATIGFLQFIAPSLQFLIGVFMYHEHFGFEQAIGFAMIWFGVAIYLVDLKIKD